MGLLFPLSHEIFGACNLATFLIGLGIEKHCFVGINVNCHGLR